MASKSSLFTAAMILRGLLTLITLHLTDADVGVCYGRQGNQLPPPSEVVALCKEYNIRKIRIYDSYPPVLQALSGSNITVMLGIPNTELQFIASSQTNANIWVQNNVKKYPNVTFGYIVVGNEVSPLTSDTALYVPFVLPAMRNIQTAISAAGLTNQIKVSTAIETAVLTNSILPLLGKFRPIVLPYLNSTIQFLVKNQAPLLVNIYPYFAIASNAGISLEYALFTSPSIVTPDGARYQNLFDVMLDSTYAALEKLGGGSIEIIVSETGWPTSGGVAATVDNARIYITNLIKHVLSGGSPKRPGRPIETYIYALFDEDLKKPEVEKRFGLFYPNKQPKYEICY